MSASDFVTIASIPAERPPEEIAAIHEDQRWTWGRLHRRAAQWAGVLGAHGVGADELVAFALPNDPEFYAISFGIYMVGATPAPLSPKLPAEEAKTILELMQPAARIGVLPDALAPPAADAPAELAPWRGHVAAGWKACTSGGSSGRPKVIIDGRPALLSVNAPFLRIPQNSKVLIPGPLYHNASFGASIYSFVKNSSVVTMARFDAEQCLALIDRERIEWAVMVPTMMQRILRLDLSRFDLSSWKGVAHTAAPMPPAAKQEWIERFGADHIGEAYGSTEGLVRTWITGREWLERPGSVGRPAEGDIRILDPEGVEVPTGEDGEIFAIPPSGPGTSYRYLGAERRAIAGGWESVGDIGHVDADEYLYLADRRDDLIVSGGVNVWPAEVEAALSRHPDIISCAVFGVPDADLGQHVHAVVEVSDAAPTAEAIKQFLRDYIVPQKIPRSFAFADGPVRDDAGKVRKSKLLKEYLAGA